MAGGLVSMQRFKEVDVFLRSDPKKKMEHWLLRLLVLLQLGMAELSLKA